MAYLTIARYEGDGRRLLDAYMRTSEVMDRVGHDHGLLLHAGARTDDGMLIVNVWPSREGSESAAADERRVAVLGREQAAIQGASREHHELARCVVAP